MVEHAQLAHTLRASLEALGFAPPGTRWRLLASTAFDVSVLGAGRAAPGRRRGAVVPPERSRGPGGAGRRAVADVTRAARRPGADAPGRGGGARRADAARRCGSLLVGGDALPPDLLADMREVFPAAGRAGQLLRAHRGDDRLRRRYAVPAEGAVAGHPHRPAARRTRAWPSAGPRGELVPVGVPGELWIWAARAWRAATWAGRS